MTVPWETIAQEGFEFFGKMSASISHEIKNALAIMNESAGLLEDFALLANQGRPIDPERLKALAGKVIGQIKRADTLVKRMNRFAHSADEPLKVIDVGETLELLIAISQRLAVMRGVAVELVVPDQPVRLATNPFLLENVVWLCLDYLWARGYQAVRFRPESTTDGACIRMTCSGTEKAEAPGNFPSERERDLLAVLQADVGMNPAVGEMTLALRRQD